MSRVLIVALGNPLRCDDGVAWHAAELLERDLAPSRAEILCVHQLMPELAESLSRADAVVFLDAACDGAPGQIVLREVCADRDATGFSHGNTPGRIVALCEEIYGVRPRAHAVTLTGESFDHGDELSETIRNSLPRLVTAVKESVDRLCDSGH